MADFGIARALGGGADDARLTETGLAVGTPAYMSPEQASGQRELDGRSDVYSLAVVLYEMLAGETPFAAPTAQAMIARRFTETARPIRQAREAVPESVERALQRALARTPADRFATAAEFGAALETGSTVESDGGRLLPGCAPPRSPPGLAARRLPRWRSSSDSSSAPARCSPGGAATPARTTAPAAASSRCSRSRTWATPPTPTSPTAWPTRCGPS